MQKEKLNGHSNGKALYKSNGYAVYKAPAIGRTPKHEKAEDFSNIFLALNEEAEERGHALSEFRKNGTKYPVYVATCLICSAHAIVDPSKEDIEQGLDGVALRWSCDPKATIKTGEFKHEPMSEQHKKRISGPWKHPADTSKLK